MNKLWSKNWFRWVCVIPCAFGGALIASAAYKIFIVFNFWCFGFSRTSIFAHLQIDLVAAYLFGAFFINAGIFAAPNYRRETASVLAALGTALLGALLPFLMMSHETRWWEYGMLACNIIGVAKATYDEVSKDQPIPDTAKHKLNSMPPQAKTS